MSLTICISGRKYEGRSDVVKIVTDLIEQGTLEDVGVDLNYIPPQVKPPEPEKTSFQPQTGTMEKKKTASGPAQKSKK